MAWVKGQRWERGEGRCSIRSDAQELENEDEDEVQL